MSNSPAPMVIQHTLESTIITLEMDYSEASTGCCTSQEDFVGEFDYRCPSHIQNIIQPSTYSKIVDFANSNYRILCKPISKKIDSSLTVGTPLVILTLGLAAIPLAAILARLHRKQKKIPAKMNDILAPMNDEEWCKYGVYVSFIRREVFISTPPSNIPCAHTKNFLVIEISHAQPVLPPVPRPSYYTQAKNSDATTYSIAPHSKIPSDIQDPNEMHFNNRNCFPQFSSNLLDENGSFHEVVRRH
eukprot:TRINITY_DN3864_c0_g1_i2.p1 TRINITY_DN3864_c0_g1~~TRINITY_DN3864_c0_g1_i2.p1  ORF type:complete len:245 (-),score=48.36 TRINITY_DN3864_c0_g1_i2:323-1057(-)